MAIGLVVSLPLGVLASPRPMISETLLGVAGILQTIPSLAVLVIMVPLLGVIGFAPALVALSLYSVLPILANTVTGLQGIDPSLVEAARGLGMNARQMLRQVQLPLAMPVIISGVRTATVLTVGTATLATPVGALCLGNYIFSGLETNDMTATIFGCVCTALLAVLLDQLVRLLEVAARRRSRRHALLGAAGLAVVVAGGLYGPAANWLRGPAPVVAASNFTEQYILAAALKAELQDAGFRIEQRDGVGNTVLFLGLKHNQIDCAVTYSGDVWATLLKRRDVADRVTTFELSRQYLREHYGIECLGPLGFENSYALAMHRPRAERLGIRSIADLAAQASGLSFAGDLAFFERQEWGNLRDQYGLHFKEVRPMDVSLLYAAAEEGAVDVACVYTTDARILERNLVILDDPRQVFPPYDAMLLLSAQAAADARFVAALRPLVRAIDVDRMRRANLEVDVRHRSPRDAARKLLSELSPKH
ncbi:MAG: ABC transporter permease/substrate-binding protein [Planctomycetia bacterium]|nr:ABC transporter permease/substrate-binding protein [Planctomycetia bacterium]